MTIKEKAKQLITSGYDDDVIFLVLGISRRDVEIIKKQNESPKRKSKLQILRETYQGIYYGENNISKKDVLPLSTAKIEEINNFLDEIEPQIKNVQQRLYTKRNEMMDLIRKLGFLDDLSLSLDIAERVYKLFPEKKKIYKIQDISYRQKLIERRNKYKTKYFASIEEYMLEEDNIEVLNDLLEKIKKIFPDSQYTQGEASVIQNKITKRISYLKTNQNQLNQLQDVSSEVRKIAELIVGDEYNEEKIKEIILQESQVYLEKRNKYIKDSLASDSIKSLQLLTLERAKKQIYYQIGNLIKSGSNNIVNIEDSYQRLVNINHNWSVSLNIVIENLLVNKRFEEANSFVEMLFKSIKNPDYIKIRKQMKLKIRNSEISYFIMKGINAEEDSIDDEDKYYQLIEKGIEQSNISPISIVLGKTFDGLRNITWYDIMEKQKEKEK